MKATIATLPGDGIGPEVMVETLRVLSAIGSKYGHDFTTTESLIGGIAIDETGNPLPDETIKTCEEADAILLAAVGGPKWSDPTSDVRPEQGLLKIRQHFGLFANLRPVKTYPALASHVPLRADLIEGVDILFVRELTGGIYFGQRKEMGDSDEAYDTMLYSRPEVERLAHVAFRAAQGRRNKVTSVDKANVLASMRLWRKTVVQVAEDYEDVELEHLLVDACTMHLLTRPSSFDVIMAGNMFGDILSDEASVLAGSLGMLPSASLGAGRFGMYEPVHGSAPDIAGQGKANPIGMLLSLAMLLRYSLELEEEARAIETAIDDVLADGLRTPDIASKGEAVCSTTEFVDAVLAKLA
ncbi:3-isopropylmalate dehydrogenase [Phototrophicus methaneseepsis]|uniref:3-isopropylmalate dehydrogenase n=1 Tax=Phototrophicus methaneseepsis TaxID=2710758 RepID=A0A7S8E603_9CHLR|nr:3-isopropylmalate dehydrogenase [Phototrophicus methaneseepsis]QPC81006.1 3-isopropylmalate dehydrogenase [Phototrophicus methaneseepsis]